MLYHEDFEESIFWTDQKAEPAPDLPPSFTWYSHTAITGIIIYPETSATPTKGPISFRKHLFMKLYHEDFEESTFWTDLRSAKVPLS